MSTYRELAKRTERQQHGQRKRQVTLIDRQTVIQTDSTEGKINTEALRNGTQFCYAVIRSYIQRPQHLAPRQPDDGTISLVSAAPATQHTAACCSQRTNSKHQLHCLQAPVSMVTVCAIPLKDRDQRGETRKGQMDRMEENPTE